MIRVPRQLMISRLKIGKIATTKILELELASEKI